MGNQIRNQMMNKDEQINNKSQVSIPRTITSWQEALTRDLKIGDVVWEFKNESKPLDSTFKLTDYHNKFDPS
jgi:hypothetical protein